MLTHGLLDRSGRHTDDKIHVYLTPAVDGVMVPQSACWIPPTKMPYYRHSSPMYEAPLLVDQIERWTVSPPIMGTNFHG